MQRFGDALHLRRQIAIGLDRHQHLGLRQPVQRLAQVVADHTLDVVGVLHHAFQRVVLAEPLDCRFRTDLGYARHVVDRVADQAQVIDDAFRRHAELGDDAVAVEFFVAHRVDQRHMRIDQLRQILVAGRYHGIHAVPDRLHRQRADHVVGFDAFDHQDRPAHRAHRFVYRFDLPDQVVRHRRRAAPCIPDTDRRGKSCLWRRIRTPCMLPGNHDANGVAY